MVDCNRAKEDLIVLRCQLGEANAYDELVVLMQDRLSYYIRRFLKDDDLVYDVLQEVWIKVFRRLRGLRKIESFRPWIYRIVHNEIVNHTRHQVSRERAESTFALDSAMEENDDEWNLRDASAIYDLLEGLKPEHREVLTLFFLEDMKYEEIATVLGCSIGTVKSRMFYAKQYVRHRKECSNVKGCSRTTEASRSVSLPGKEHCR